MKLIKLGKNSYRFCESENVSIEGNLAFVVGIMRDRYSIPQGDIDRALLDMLATGHDVALFGEPLNPAGSDRFGGRFICTDSSVREKNLLAELHAIQSLREEIVEAHRQDGYRTPRVVEMMNRLESLYVSLNITGLITLAERYQDVAAA